MAEGTQYYAIYAGTDTSNMQILCSSDYNPGVLSAKLDKEINSAGSLSLTVKHDHPAGSILKRYLTVVDVYLRGYIVFRGRIFDITTDFYGQMEISCEGNLAWFIDNYCPKSTEVLENVKAFNSVVKGKIASFNQNMEAYKQFKFGLAEPPNYSGNLISDPSTIYKNYKVSTEASNVLVAANGWMCSSAYIPYNGSKSYVVYVGTYEAETSASTRYYVLYDSTTAILGTVNGSELTAQKITQAGIDISTVSSFRVSGQAISSGGGGGSSLDSEYEVYVTAGTWFVRSRPSSKSSALPGGLHQGDVVPYVNTTNANWLEIIYNGQHAYTSSQSKEIRPVSTPAPVDPQEDTPIEDDLFWLTTKDEEIEPDGNNTWGGGSWGDYFSSWLVDSQHMMIRARVINNANVLDVLNPERRKSVEPVSEFVLADNMLDMQTESAEFEAYSYIYPVFEGEADNRFSPREIPGAVAVYGKIYKAIDFGAKPTTTSQTNVFNDRMDKLLALHDPSVPEQFTVKGFDKRIIFDDISYSYIDVGDVVKVKSKFHLGGSVNLLCLRMSLDILAPENNEYTIGQYIDDSEDVRIKTLTESFTRKK